jgi:predicted nucleic acid-binding protein
MTLVDTNVVVDVLTQDAAWAAWSRTELNRYRAAGLLYISDMTYAELAVSVDTEDKLQLALAELRLTVERITTEALFLAGKVFRRYRDAGGPRTSVLPDFFHRRPCASRSSAPTDERPAPLSNVFSRGRADYPRLVQSGIEELERNDLHVRSPCLRLSRLVRASLSASSKEMKRTTSAIVPSFYRENFLYLILCGIVESVPSRRILSVS